jgi:hypothetical protein
MKYRLKKIAGLVIGLVFIIAMIVGGGLSGIILNKLIPGLTAGEWAIAVYLSVFFTFYCAVSFIKLVQNAAEKY